MNDWRTDSTGEMTAPDFLFHELPTPFSSRVEVDFAARTDRGLVRQGNEDSYIIFRASRLWERMLTSLDESALPQTHEERGFVMAVADGMGGHRGGAVASSLALRTGVAMILNAAAWGQKCDNPLEREAAVRMMIDHGKDYFQKIDRTVADQAIADPSLAGMGTTLTAAYSIAEDLFILHVGDSRAYLFRAGKLQQLTHDHTLVQTLVDAGTISAEEAATHRLRHVLVKAIGRGKEFQAEVHHARLADGDQLLLCSDGLSGMVSDDRIADVLGRGLTAEATCQALVDEALAAGGKDNVTVLLGRYRIPPR